MATDGSPYLEATVEIDLDNLDREAVASWAKETFSPDEIFDADELKLHITANFGPQDVFDEADLETWAESNGWTKEEK